MALDFLAGTCGGFAGTLVGHPFDTIKVRLQNHTGNSPRYRSTFHCFSQIIKTESVSGLYKGMASPMAGQLLINSIVFGIHGNMIKLLRNDGLWGQFLAGSSAGAVQSLVCGPLELAKIRLQLQGEGESRVHTKTYKKCTDQNKYRGPLACIQKIYKTEGLRGCCRGMYATLLREVPSFGVYFVSYNALCQWQKIEEGSINVLRLFLCGGTSGILAWLVSYPVDVIKTRLQADGMGRTVYHGIIDCAIKSWHGEGFTVFFKGLNATLIRAFPTNAATLATVSVVLSAANK